MQFTEANFLALIRSAEGTPYLYGGIDPFGGGADCSGLIYWAGLRCGIILPRTTSAEWAELPHFAAVAMAPVGSIIEFEVPADGGPAPQHVGVNVGNDFMIDDPHTGTVVRQELVPDEPGVIWPIGYCLLPFETAPAPGPVIKEVDTLSIAIAPDGTRVIERVNPAGHLLAFEYKPGAVPTVTDVTAAIAKANPTAPPFVVEP